jgi:hypothetical protein
MLTRQQSRVRCLATFVLLAAIMLSTAEVAFAQEEHRSSIFTDILKDVALDPTTYAPAIIGYDATMRDWNTSQPFFQSGYVEHNARFTVSGLPNDRAIGYEAGKHQILMDSLTNLQMSLVNNVTDRLIERVLIERHPQHRTLFRALGWAERIGFASAMSYKLSAAHYRQAGQNQQLAQQIGIH